MGLKKTCIRYATLPSVRAASGKRSPALRCAEYGKPRLVGKVPCTPMYLIGGATVRPSGKFIRGRSPGLLRNEFVGCAPTAARVRKAEVARLMKAEARPKRAAKPTLPKTGSIRAPEPSSARTARAIVKQLVAADHRMERARARGKTLVRQANAIYSKAHKKYRR